MNLRGAFFVAWSLCAFAGNMAASAGDRPARRGYPILEVLVLSASGAPCPGAEVWAREREVRPGMDSRNSFAESDASGLATLRELRTSHLYDLMVFHRDLPAMRRDEIYVPPGTSRITLKATRGHTVSGRVIGEDGKPLAGASVHLAYPGRLPASLWAPPLTSTVVTGSDGDFAVERVGDGVWGVVAHVPGLTGWRTGVSAGDADVVISMRRSSTLVVTGFPESFRGSAATLWGIDVPFRFAAEVDEAGVLQVTGVPEGTYTLSVKADPRLSIPVIRVTEGDPSTIRIEVPSPPAPEMLRIRGRVRRTDGTSAPGGKVGLFVERPEGYLTLVSTIVDADEDGRFLVETWPHVAGFRLRAAAIFDGTAGMSEARIGEGDMEVVLAHSTRRLEGIRVQELETERGVEGAEVRVLSVMGGGDFLTGPDGRASPVVDVLPRALLPTSPTGESLGKLQRRWTRKVLGTVEIRVNAPWFLPAVRVLGETPERVEIKLRRAQVVEGCVVDMDGRPAAGIRIRTADGTADTDVDGRFVLIRGRDGPEAPRLVWSPLPDWRPVEMLPCLESAKEEGVYRIPDARRWPLELAFGPKNEGRSVLVTLPGAPAVGPTPQVIIDSRGRCRKIDLLAGDYVLRLLEGNKTIEEFDLSLEPEPASGGWRRYFTR